jgi:hypothetical protein
MTENKPDSLNTAKPPMTLKMTDLIAISVLLLSPLAYTVYSLNQSVSELQRELAATPKIAVIDMQQLLDNRINAGEEPAKAIRYSKLLAQAAIEEGFILIEKNTVLAIPESARLPEAPAEQLEAFLKERGIEVEPLEHFQRQIKEEEAKNRNVIDRILGN